MYHDTDRDLGSKIRLWLVLITLLVSDCIATPNTPILFEIFCTIAEQFPLETDPVSPGSVLVKQNSAYELLGRFLQ